MPRLGKLWPWRLLTSLYGWMQNFNGNIHLKPLVEAYHDKASCDYGNFWLLFMDRCRISMWLSIFLYMLLFLHNLHFIFKKLAMKIYIDTYNSLEGMYIPLYSIVKYQSWISFNNSLCILNASEWLVCYIHAFRLIDRPLTWPCSLYIQPLFHLYSCLFTFTKHSYYLTFITSPFW